MNNEIQLNISHQCEVDPKLNSINTVKDEINWEFNCSKLDLITN